MIEANGLSVTPSAEVAPVLSIVIVSWNEWPNLQLCLTSIYRSARPETEILVIDNGSADGTPDLVRQEFPAVRLYCNTRNLGASKALNSGFARARGDFVIKLDADTELMPDCIDRLLTFMREHPEVDVVGPRTLNTDGTIQETARNFPGALSGIFGRQSTLTRWFPNNPVSRRYLARQFLDATEPFEVDQVGGAFMLFRRRVLTDVGYLDEGYYHYWDDTDWCYRMRAARKRLFCVPAALAYHHEGNARGKRKRPKRIWMFHYNAYRFYTRWRTLGYWDPRSIFAGIALLGRALMLMGYHSILLGWSAPASSSNGPAPQRARVS
jgi:N-acetylglucosaminyl-diphospho-decaprenol L-rhamnosyltransferase